MDHRANEEQFRKIEEQFKAISDMQVAATQEKQKAEVMDVLVKLLSVTFDKMSAYTSLIVIGGYAAFFSVWGAVERFVSPSVRLWAFGLVGISALLFVSSETYRSTKFTVEMQRLLRTLKDIPLSEFKQRHDQLTKLLDSRNVQRLGRLRVMHAVTLFPAVIGALVLFCGIAHALWNGAH
jgi:hypothetical protein